MIQDEGRRYDRAEILKTAPSATHRLCTGWKGDNAYPYKLPGMVIALNSLLPSGKGRPVAIDCMARLGFGDEAAINATLKSGKGNLPTSLTVELTANARWVGCRWSMAGIYDDTYGDKGKGLGFRCRGDGVTASELQADRTRKVIECNPVGKRGVDPQCFCPVSVSGVCKTNLYFIFRMLYLGADGRMAPLSRIPGATCIWKSTSEPSGLRIANVLIDTANRLRMDTPGGIIGYLSGLRGTLVFNLESREYDDKGKRASAIMGGLSLILDKDEVERRESMIWDRANKVEMAILTGPTPRAALPEPVLPDPLDEDDGHDDAPESTPIPEDCQPVQPAQPTADDLPFEAEPAPAPASAETEQKPEPVKLSMRELGAMFRDKFKQAGLDPVDAGRLIREHGFNPARIEADLNAIIAAQAEGDL